jgi:hypothetical protein
MKFAKSELSLRTFTNRHEAIGRQCPCEHAVPVPPLPCKQVTDRVTSTMRVDLQMIRNNRSEG